LAFENELPAIVCSVDLPVRCLHIMFKKASCTPTELRVRSCRSFFHYYNMQACCLFPPFSTTL